MIRTIFLWLLVTFPLTCRSASLGGKHAPVFDNSPGWVGLFGIVAFVLIWLLPFLHHRPLLRLKTTMCVAIVALACPFLFWASFFSSGPSLAGRIVFLLIGMIVLAGIPLYWYVYVRPSGDKSTLRQRTDRFLAIKTLSNSKDPIQKADVYLAYGRSSQAQQVLNAAILRYPSRAIEFKTKLEEIKRNA